MAEAFVYDCHLRNFLRHMMQIKRLIPEFKFYVSVQHAIQDNRAVKC